jgi:hypothetical protein
LYLLIFTLANLSKSGKIIPYHCLGPTAQQILLINQLTYDPIGPANREGVVGKGGEWYVTHFPFQKIRITDRGQDNYYPLPIRITPEKFEALEESDGTC